MGASTNGLLTILKKPSQIASALDWKKVTGGTLLSMDVHPNRIGMAIASHPLFRHSHQEGDKQGSLHTLEPIQFPNNHIHNIDRQCLKQLSSVCHKYKVCGIIVAWPLQHDTGKMGAACGRVLFALEHLLQEQEKAREHGTRPHHDDDEEDLKVLTPQRPLCFWDPAHPTARTARELQEQKEQHPELFTDEFGRCATYCRTSKKSIHCASSEQYHEDENLVPLQVWEDFCRVHWPDLDESGNDDVGVGNDSITSSAMDRDNNRYRNDRVRHVPSNRQRKSLIQS